VPRAVPSREASSRSHAAPPPPPLPRATSAMPKLVPQPAPQPAKQPAPPTDPLPLGPPTTSTAIGARAQSQAVRSPAGDGKDLDQAALDALLDQGSYDDALSICQIAVKRNPHDRVARSGIELAEGLRAIAAKDRLEAAQRFEVVLEIDPSNERAARELAEMRRMATTERKGLLTRLLGKKE
jgi:hypothetical protein